MIGLIMNNMILSNESIFNAKFVTRYQLDDPFMNQIRNHGISIDTRYFISIGTGWILREILWDFLYDMIDHE